MNVDFLKDVALAVAQEQHLETVMKMIVEGINEDPDVALVRLWILESDDNSTECHLRPEAPNQTRCLHLVASAGHALNEHEDWSRLDGAFGRVPLGVGKIGLIGQSGESILIPDLSIDQRWVVRPEWVKQEAIRSFAGHPLKFRKGVLGVLGVFSRAQLTEDEFGWLRTFADSAAVAITNARRFQALRASEQRLQDIIDNTTAVIFVKDLQLRYLLVNREHERRYCVRREEIRGKSDFDIHPREVAEAVRANDLRVIEAGEPSRFEEVVPSVDGEPVYLALKFLLRDRAGKPYALCGIATDITELKRAEKLEAQMAHERAMFLEEKTRLAGEIHDSLAQSFTVITMQLDMAKEVMTGKDNDALAYIERADDLARFGLAEARRSVLGLQPVVTKDSGLIESLQRLVGRSNIPGRLRCTFRSNRVSDETLPLIVRQDLLRIAQEAISNALRHAKSTTLNVTLCLDPPNLILKVKDNGCGIPTAEIREGFGFVNMRARVNKLNGVLTVRTAPGRGTSIVVCVPVSG
jgi:PAS domain S-box-containing protein